jgi:hypothetical protein
MFACLDPESRNLALLPLFQLTLVGSIFFGVHAFKLARWKGPVITLGTTALSIHYTGDEIPYSAIERIRSNSVPLSTTIAISFKRGVQSKLQYLPFRIRLKNWSRLTLPAVYKISGEELVEQIKSRADIAMS